MIYCPFCRREDGHVLDPVIRSVYRYCKLKDRYRKHLLRREALLDGLRFSINKTIFSTNVKVAAVCLPPFGDHIRRHNSVNNQRYCRLFEPHAIA